MDDTETVYAITFGSSYFKIEKYCDQDFGFNFASRIEYSNIKTTTLTAPNLNRNKIVNTYIINNVLDFNSGESFSKLKVNAKLDEDFTIFKSAIEIGNSIRFTIDNETIDGVLDLIMYVEEVLKKPVIHRIPLFQIVKEDFLLDNLNQKINYILKDTLLGPKIQHYFLFQNLK